MKNVLQNKLRRHQFLVGVLWIILVLLVACSEIPTKSVQIAPFIETSENYPRAEVIFNVTVTQDLAENESLVIELLDDLTGEFFNPTQYKMSTTDGKRYSINLPFIVGEKVKYRYLRYGNEIFYEYTAKNEPIHHRLYYVNGPGLVEDMIYAWPDQPYSGSYGKIRGQLVERSTNSPIPNMAIYAAGARTISAADGSFILEGLAPGVCNVVLASLDGAYETFQQGAMIAEESTTPIVLELSKRTFVDISFTVKVPEGYRTELPVRFASNLYSLGYPETALAAGGYTSSINMPVFNVNPEMQHSLTLSLPAGEHIRYKFTLGDGFWNAELNQEGNIIVRDLIVPKKDGEVKKEVDAFNSPGVGPILFDVTTPASTPLNEEVMIQFNAFGWTEPLPMRKSGENHWIFALNSPIHLFSGVEYRFCRNGNCDKAASDPVFSGTVAFSEVPQTISVNIENWQNLEVSGGLTNVETNGGTIQPRQDFITGFELVSDFPITWQSHIDDGLASIAGTAANWVIFSPTWSVSDVNPPLFEPVPGNDLLWPDLRSMSAHISGHNLQPVIFPVLSDQAELDDFWNSSTRDVGWWQTFFERYQRFILQNADLAQVTEASAFILGDPGLQPSMGGGTLTNGESSNPPENANEQWAQLVRDVRAHYSGPILGVMSVPNASGGGFPSWLFEVDAIYVLYTSPLNGSNDSTVLSLVTSFDQSFEADILQVFEELGKPVIIGMDYPSNTAALIGCNPINGSCLSYGSGDFSDIPIDLEIQSRIYNAAILSCARHPWINGFIARGFNPNVLLKDNSSSLYGKPASDVLWFWFHFLQNRPS